MKILSEKLVQYTTKWRTVPAGPVEFMKKTSERFPIEKNRFIV